MNPQEEDQVLEKLLHEPLPYIEDDGFTARVMERLPPARTTLAWVRIFIVLSFSTLAALLVLVYKPLSTALAQAFRHLAQPGAPALSPLPLASAVLLLMLLWVGVTAAQSE